MFFKKTKLFSNITVLQYPDNQELAIINYNVLSMVADDKSFDSNRTIAGLTSFAPMSLGRAKSLRHVRFFGGANFA